MSLLLLDTAFLIDAERGSAELDDVIGDDDDVAIAAIRGHPSAQVTNIFQHAPRRLRRVSQLEQPIAIALNVRAHPTRLPSRP